MNIKIAPVATVNRIGIDRGLFGWNNGPRIMKGRPLEGMVRLVEIATERTLERSTQ